MGFKEAFLYRKFMIFYVRKLSNVIVVKLRQNGKVVAEYKADAKKCSSKLK